MSKPDELLVNISAKVESENTNQMSLTVVVGGTVITGRLAPERVWRERVSEVLKDSSRLGPFADVFGESRGEGPPDGRAEGPPESRTEGPSGGRTEGPSESRAQGPSAGPPEGPSERTGGGAGRTPTHLHFHLARILQGNVGIPETGGMYRVAIADVSAWTVGDFSYSDQ
ncbi:hypothetical protein [Streptomyces sp. NPDC017941]|uniref:hypothetical protein n=1 Tax=unclassified Streptomyces TaxID=2593676 RepID=UPI0037B059FE